MLLDKLRVLQGEREGVAGSPAMADQDQPLGPLRDDRLQLGANRFGVPFDRPLRIRLDEVDRLPRHAPCPQLLDILQEVSGHLLVEEPADEDIAVAARVVDRPRPESPACPGRAASNQARNCSGVTLEAASAWAGGTKHKASSVKNPSTADSFEVK